MGDGVEEGRDRLIVRAVLTYMAAVILATVLLGAVIGGTVYLVWWGLATFFDHISEID